MPKIAFGKLPIELLYSYDLCNRDGFARLWKLGPSNHLVFEASIPTTEKFSVKPYWMNFAFSIRLGHHNLVTHTGSLWQIIYILLYIMLIHEIRNTPIIRNLNFNCSWLSKVSNHTGDMRKHGKTDFPQRG